MDEHVEQYHPRISRAAAPPRNGLQQLLALHASKPLNQPSNPTSNGQTFNSQLLRPLSQLVSNPPQPGPSQASCSVSSQVASSNPTRSYGSPHQTVTENPGYHEKLPVAASQAWSLESQRSTVNHCTNLMSLKESGLSKTMEFTSSQTNLNSPRNSPQAKSPINLFVTHSKGNSPTPINSTDPIQYVKSIWEERSPLHSPKSEKTEAINAPIEPLDTACDTQNGTENSKETKDSSKETKYTSISAVGAKVAPPMVSSQVNNQMRIPVVNFQPDFVKTIYQFGYKLSIHILSLNAIIKLQGYYRYFFVFIFSF